MASSLARPERLGDRHQGTVHRVEIGEIVQRVTDPHDGVRLRDRVVGQSVLADLLSIADVVPRQLEHRRGGIRGERPMPGVHEVSCERPAAAPDLEDQPVALEHRLEEAEGSRAQSSAWKPNPRWWISARSRW